MLNAFATPQIYITGRILNANGFNSDELYIKYKILIGSNFTLIDGELEGETFQCLSSGQENVNVVHFDQPLNINLSCRSITGWPKILIEVWSNEIDSRNCLMGYGVAYFPVKKGFSKMCISCWRPSESVNSGLGELFLGNNPEFEHKSAIYSVNEKFGVYSISTGQVNLEVEMIFKDFNLHGIKI
jgi:B9 domain-containing protein 2